MQRKAQLAAKIAESIKAKKMLDCLARLGRNVKIVVGPARRSRTPGHVEVEFA
ncbi:MAG: hypothetical protein WBA83_06720 [Burkholderiaceae bacterium]